jgi:predicted DsbA family dithiol-disulfide isomerase
VRLDQLQERLGDAVEIEWKAFMLRPQPEERTQEKFVNYTQSWLRPAEMEPLASFVPWATENPAPSHSLPALVAGKIVESINPELAGSYHRALLKAYFTDNRTISADAVYRAIADETGIDVAAFDDELATNRDVHVNQVIDDHNEALAAGINAVPTVLMAGSFPVPGAQDVATYERLVTKIAER